MSKVGNKTLRKVAIFDIDGTVFRSSLLVELVETLIARGIFPEEAWSDYQREERAWLEREGSYEAYVSAIVLSFRKHLRGVHYADFLDVSKEVVIHSQNRVYRYTRDLVKDLKRRGYYLLAISQSPKTVVESFAKHVGFDKVYGRIYELGPEDHFTGDLVDVHLIENKANIVRRAVEREGLTLNSSYGVGDTEGDIPMLELVKYPIAFNPNAKLYRYARRMGWRIVVERKDVIYKF
ncbi:MAG TPA: HAD family phosphatase [Candidatus Paceibacterota bacterium]